MSLHSELPALPVELHSCSNARDYFGGSCRCALNTTVISSDHPCDYILNAARSKARDREIETNFDGVTFAEHFGGVSLSSVPRDQHSVLFHHRRLHHQGRSRWEFGNESRSNGAEQESPIDPVASFECSAMLDSEPSASPASSVSPGSLPPPLPHGNSPLVTHHTTTPNYEIISSNHQHHHHHQQQELSGMNTQHQVTNNLHNNNHHQLHHHSHLQRGPKRRAVDNVPLDGGVPGNRKERRRTQSINTAFAELRECIPNVPADTKLSKIKTLRLATSYIAYLTDMVSRDDNMNGDMETTTLSGLMVEGIGDVATMPMIRQDFSLTCRSIIKDTIKHETTARNDCEVKRKRNRTGWPEHVWALELQH